MEFEVITSYKTLYSCPVLKILNHEKMGNIIIAVDILNDGKADITLLQGNDTFDIIKDQDILVEWLNGLLKKVAAFKKLTE